MSALVLGTTGFAFAQYSSLTSALHESNALDGEARSTDATNILVMGLDSRLDENGNPLPPTEYDALHAGTAADGGMNSNVLILLHVPNNPGQKATAISIPRDDYAHFPDCPYGQCSGKIKQAYGLAYAQAHDKLAASGVSDPAELNARARDAARRQQINTVRQFVGGVPIDHFIEVTMAAFYEIAQVEAPIQVCVNENTQDSFSGANFHRGINELSAGQAVAFVRQRRDPETTLNFTELDRERRQQAFIASLAYKLRHSGTFADPSQLGALTTVAQNNMAVDSGLNLIQFAQQASSLTSGKITFFTLPVKSFTQVGEEDVNQVDPTLIHQIVHQLTNAGTGAPAPPPKPTVAPPKPTVDVANASGVDGLAGRLENGLAGQGYPGGQAATAGENQSRSVVKYSPGDDPAAGELAARLGGLPIEPSSSLPAGHLLVVLGTEFSMPPALRSGSSGSPDYSHDAVTNPAGDGSAPAPPVLPDNPMPNNPGTQSSSINGGGIPCVK